MFIKRIASIVLLLAVAVGAVYLVKSPAGQKIITPVDKLKAQWEASGPGGKKTLEELEGKYQKGLELKEKIQDAAKITQELDTIASEKAFKEKFDAIKSALDSLQKNHPEAKATIEQQLQKLNQIELNFKESNKPVQELLNELTELGQTIIKESSKATQDNK